ncbi:hypothetical protein CPB85DRAFT_1430340 [Mucidula mucida]|nr:hypothetical protein CPB85DRAFT_1430340 [Mucidula mucida]
MPKHAPVESMGHPRPFDDRLYARPSLATVYAGDSIWPTRWSPSRSNALLASLSTVDLSPVSTMSWREPASARYNTTPPIDSPQVHTPPKAPHARARIVEPRQQPPTQLDQIKQEPGSPTFIIESLQSCPSRSNGRPSARSPIPEGESYAVEATMLEQSLLSQSLAPPTEVPLRATQANGEMRAMMGVFRLNPFSMHGGAPPSPDLTWCGEEPGPLPESPQIIEWELEEYDSGIPDFEPLPSRVLDEDLERLERFSPPISGSGKRKREQVDDGEDIDDRPHTHLAPSWTSVSPMTYPSTVPSPAQSIATPQPTASRYPSVFKQESESESESPPSEPLSTTSSLAGCMGEGSLQTTVRPGKFSSSFQPIGSPPQAISAPQGIASMLNQPRTRQPTRKMAEYNAPSAPISQGHRRMLDSYTRNPQFTAPPRVVEQSLYDTSSWNNARSSRNSVSPPTIPGTFLTPAQQWQQQNPSMRYDSDNSSSTSSSSNGYTYAAPEPSYSAQTTSYTYSTYPTVSENNYTRAATIPRRIAAAPSYSLGSGIMYGGSREPETAGYYA